MHLSLIGKSMVLNPEAEEVASFYAVMRDTEHVQGIHIYIYIYNIEI